LPPRRRPAVHLGHSRFDADGALPGTFEAQFGNVVTNIKRILDEAGATFRDLVKLNVLLTRRRRRHDEQALCGRVRAGPYPARTTCVVGGAA